MGDKGINWRPRARWAARIWSLGPILFGLAEVFLSHAEPGVQVVWTEWLALGLLGAAVTGLALAWRWPRLGGWMTIGLMLVFSLVFLLTVERWFPVILILWLGVGAPAGLFLASATTPGGKLGNRK